MATYKEALQAKERLVRRWNSMPGVVGIGIGYANGKNHRGGLCVVLYTVNASTAVRRSCPQSVALKKKKRLGTKVPVRVIVSGRCSCQPRVTVAASPRNIRGRIRPVVAGYSVGFPGVSGTAGLIVRAARSRAQRYLLSNNHVLNRNNSSSLSQTIQPGGADGGVAPRDTIGRLYRFVRLRRDRANLMDAAISIPRSNALLASRYAGVGRVRGYVRSYALGARLKKVGRTTGFVRGEVVSVNTDVIVDYGSYGGLGRIRFRNQTVIRGSRPVSLAGDSGSVWLTGNNYAAAVNFAGTADGRMSIAFPIRWAVQAFRIRPIGAGIARGKKGTVSTRSLSKVELRQIRGRIGKGRA
ncbi:hypothetical protein ACAF76_004685 [Brevibacillus sp. TJ4]|uniref:hypothetical protein n=1 Tax=Brevibacillus sp. TJ4 TaxID=3234853 RepID=UPI0037CF3206